jgi:hypothetical protein
MRAVPPTWRLISASSRAAWRVAISGNITRLTAFIML